MIVGLFVGMFSEMRNRNVHLSPEATARISIRSVGSAVRFLFASLCLAITSYKSHVPVYTSVAGPSWYT